MFLLENCSLITFSTSTAPQRISFGGGWHQPNIQKSARCLLFWWKCDLTLAACFKNISFSPPKIFVDNKYLVVTGRMLTHAEVNQAIYGWWFGCLMCWMLHAFAT